MNDRDRDPAAKKPDGDITRINDDTTRLDDADDPTLLEATRTAGPGSGAPAPPGDLPESIGSYRIVGKLGEGGMGVVYEAEQRHPRRKVALKVVRGGSFVDEHHVRMFQREADTLGRLKHPNIAAIYESGRTDDGQHFFAMELVRGTTLHAYLKSRNKALDPEELKHRLRMFRKACDAVQYAHQRGVIHRDLKPGNIIVTEAGSDPEATSSDTSMPEVKILDFGLARITDTDVQATMVSEVGMIKGTLGYMSPEQARGNPEEIDVRTDVYALGIILYEMLTGLRPYDVQRASLIDAVRVICEQPPIPLRQQWSGVRKLDPDLETIVGKALEKEAEQRYGSAAALSEDIERYLTAQPILARPPSTTYQLRKLVQRHKLPFAFAATLVLLLIGFGIGMSFLYVRAVHAEEQATLEAETSTEALDFMVGMFEVSDPSEARGNSITAREILDRGAERIRGDLEEQPEVQSRLMHTMGLVYRSLGLYPEAKGLFEETRDVRSSYLGSDHIEVAEANIRVASVLLESGKPDEAKPLLEAALAVQERELDPNDPAIARTLNNLGIVAARSRDYETARDLWERALAIREISLGPEDPEVAKLLGVLSVSYNRLGDTDKALASLTRAISVLRTAEGDDSPDVAKMLHNLAVQQEDLGKLDEALASATEALAIKEQIYEPGHDSIAFTLNTLGQIHEGRGSLEDARGAFRRALVICDASRGEADPRTLQVRARLVDVLLKLQVRDELESEIETQLRALDARGDSGDARTVEAREAMVELLESLGRGQDARRLQAPASKN